MWRTIKLEMTFCQEILRNFVWPHDLNPQQPFGCTEKNRHKFFNILDMLLVYHVDDIIVGNDSHQNILPINHQQAYSYEK